MILNNCRLHFPQFRSNGAKVTLRHVLSGEKMFAHPTSEATIFSPLARISRIKPTRREFNLIYICQRPGSVIPRHLGIYGATQPGRFILCGTSSRCEEEVRRQVTE